MNRAPVKFDQLGITGLVEVAGPFMLFYEDTVRRLFAQVRGLNRTPVNSDVNAPLYGAQRAALCES